MLNILLKEISQFFSSVTGYLAIAVFLILLGLVVFVFPETSLFEYGYADMDSFFNSAPWVLLFLIPAINMKLFAEERRAKTLEFLYSKPVKLSGIVMGKYLAALLLVLIALLPTLIYVKTLSALAEPVGNIDTGAIFGSYIGLFLLAAVFTAIGLLASALTKNQIVAFIVAVFLCFLFYYAFESLSGLRTFSGKTDYLIQNLGIEEHYRSMSRGVIDSRDLLYFFSVIALFLLLTHTILKHRKST